MAEDQTNKGAKAPDFKGDGIAIWQNIGSNGKPYLTVKLIGHHPIYAFVNDREKRQ